MGVLWGSGSGIFGTFRGRGSSTGIVGFAKMGSIEDSILDIRTLNQLKMVAKIFGEVKNAQYYIICKSFAIILPPYVRTYRQS